MLILELFLSFFKIGLFAIGGGLATLPFLYELADMKDWINISDISNMIAISESTPGPLGVNMASYTGFLQSQYVGAIVATIGLVTPSIIISIIVVKALNKFKENKIVQNVFYGLRAASCALVSVAGLGVAKIAFFGENGKTFLWQGALLFIILYLAMKKIKWHPTVFILLSAIIGVIFKF